MKPRETLLGIILPLALLAIPFFAHAQQHARVYRIGFLSFGRYETAPQTCPTKGTPNWQAFVAGLREHGYTPGQNLLLECRYAEGRTERLPDLAAELVNLKPDLIVAFSTASVRAVKQATSTLPIVMVGVIDPVGRGLVASLARPGGNVTGPTDTVGMGIEGKRLEFLKGAAPTVSRVAVLSHPGSGGLPESAFQREREEAARALGLTLQVYDVRDPADFEAAFAAMTRARTEALFVAADPFWMRHEQRIVDLAVERRLPAIYPWKEFGEAGGLLAYYVNTPAIFRRLGVYVDKIFKGAKPADLPVEQPTKFELVINLKTAKALGLTIPPALLMRADEVIQ